MPHLGPNNEHLLDRQFRLVPGTGPLSFNVSIPPNWGDPEIPGIVHKESTDLEKLRLAGILGHGGEPSVQVFARTTV